MAHFIGVPTCMMDLLVGGRSTLTFCFFKSITCLPVLPHKYIGVQETLWTQCTDVDIPFWGGKYVFYPPPPQWSHGHIFFLLVYIKMYSWGHKKCRTKVSDPMLQEYCHNFISSYLLSIFLGIANYPFGKMQYQQYQEKRAGRVHRACANVHRECSDFLDKYVTG